VIRAVASSKVTVGCTMWLRISRTRLSCSSSSRWPCDGVLVGPDDWQSADPETVLTTLVDGMLPDEARLLSALADDADHLALGVCERAGRDGVHQVVLRVSSVGRAADIRDPELLPWYLARLEARGLVVFGTAGTAARTERVGYDRLAVEPVVTAAVRDIEARGRKATLQRLTVRRSTLGQWLWAAAHPDAD